MCALRALCAGEGWRETHGKYLKNQTCGTCYYPGIYGDSGDGQRLRSIATERAFAVAGYAACVASELACYHTTLDGIGRLIQLQR